MSNKEVCIFVGSSDAVYRESTKILCSVQNDQPSKACTKVLRDLNCLQFGPANWIHF